MHFHKIEYHKDTGFFIKWYKFRKYRWYGYVFKSKSKANQYNHKDPYNLLKEDKPVTDGPREYIVGFIQGYEQARKDMQEKLQNHFILIKEELDNICQF